MKIHRPTDIPFVYFYHTKAVTPANHSSTYNIIMFDCSSFSIWSYLLIFVLPTLHICEYGHTFCCYNEFNSRILYIMTISYWQNTVKPLITLFVGSTQWEVSTYGRLTCPHKNWPKIHTKKRFYCFVKLRSTVKVKTYVLHLLWCSPKMNYSQTTWFWCY